MNESAECQNRLLYKLYPISVARPKRLTRPDRRRLGGQYSRQSYNMCSANKFSMPLRGFPILRSSCFFFFIPRWFSLRKTVKARQAIITTSITPQYYKTTADRFVCVFFFFFFCRRREGRLMTSDETEAQHVVDTIITGHVMLHDQFVAAINYAQHDDR